MRPIHAASGSLLPIVLLAGTASAQTACGPYTIQTGDTLATISQRAYGTVDRVDDLMRENADLFRSGPDVVIAGSVMQMPCDGQAAQDVAEPVGDDVIAAQRSALAAATEGQGFGPQSPRDLDTLEGENERAFALSPPSTEMNLCNIHFHAGAEHRGGQFTRYLGNGDGEGYGTGFAYAGELTEAELAPIERPVGANERGGLRPGDTIEIHYVFTSAQVTPGPTLGACISESIGNPQLRVETVVAVLVNDPDAADFTEMAAFANTGTYFQPTGLPDGLGDPIEYPGSTTGPTYNTNASPFQVSWSVRPEVVKVDIASVDAWLGDNPFDEKYAHGVRNLVVNPALLSDIAE